MKYLLSICFLCCCHLAFASATAGWEAQLRQAVQDNNYFLVRALLPQAKKQLSREQYLYYTALAENKFDQCLASNRHIRQLLQQYPKQLNDSQIITLMNTAAGNYLRLYAYGQAVTTYQELLKKFGNKLDRKEQAAYRNMLGLFEPLAPVPPQEMFLKDDVLLPGYRNKFNHLMSPVRSGDTTIDFIFDSGAGLSTISESTAKTMGLQILESKVNVGSGTSMDVESKLAVADSLWLGRILFRNVVFLVMPDEKLSFPSVGLVIKGIIGFPVIHQLGEVHLRKDGNIFVPQTPAPAQLQNMFLDDQVPVVLVTDGNYTLLLNFDTGAKTTELSARYYQARQDLVDSIGVKTTKHFGSAGGVVAEEVYELPTFHMEIGSQAATLSNVPVHSSEKTFTKKRDGNLGQDVMTQFDEMILNFRYLYVDFKKKGTE